MVRRVNGGGEKAVGAPPCCCCCCCCCWPDVLGGETYLGDKDEGRASVCIVCLRGVDVMGDRPV